MYDVLHDGDYRRCWDENMVECYEICQLDRYNDIGYYSSKWLLTGVNCTFAEYEHLQNLPLIRYSNYEKVNNMIKINPVVEL